RTPPRFHAAAPSVQLRGRDDVGLPSGAAVRSRPSQRSSCYRPAYERRLARRSAPLLQRPLLAQRDRLGRLLVERRRRARRAALLGEAADDDRPARLPDLQFEPVACVHVLRRLGARAVQKHAPTQHRGCRAAARLEEASRPQPLVDPNGVHATRLSPAEADWLRWTGTRWLYSSSTRSSSA